MTISHSPLETFQIARRLAGSLKAGDVIALSGELGAGKTHFVKGLASGLGASAEVTSPTFTLIHEYTGGRLPLFHIDLYRLGSDAEAVAMGLEDYLGSDGVAAIEWAEKFPALVPAAARWISISIRQGDEREIAEKPAP